MTKTVNPPSELGFTPWPEALIRRYEAAGFWEGRTLDSYFLEAATATPDATAVIDGDLRLSYRELTARADGLAMSLTELGLNPDDRIVVQLPNSWELIVTLLACFRSGVLPVLALPAHRAHEISAIAVQSDARALVLPSGAGSFDHQQMAREIIATVPGIEYVLVAGGKVEEGNLDLRRLSAALAMPGVRHDATGNRSGARAVALFLLSGGTTGAPKLIARTHDDFAYYLRMCRECSQFDADTVNLAILPMSHNFQLGSVLATLLAGGRVVVGSTPEASAATATIEREQVTITAAVPAVVQRWLTYLDSGAQVDLSSLKVLVVGGARLPESVAVRISREFDCALQHGYGMAEGLVCTTRIGDPFEVAVGTQGRPMSPADELRVVDEGGHEVAWGEPGLLLTRGPYTVQGYYRADEYNRSAFTADGWYRTGDIVRLRPDGNLVVEGREKDMINRGGEKISAEEIEGFAYRVHGVLMAAVVAMPDAELGERVCLYVVCRPGTHVSLADVVSVMESAGVAKFKLPEKLLVVDALPVTKIGKIDKKALRADIEAALRLEHPQAAPATLAGRWLVTSVEKSGEREVTRTGTFDFAADGGGTVETSTGFHGALSWTQEGNTIRFDLDHDLRGGWQVRGSQLGSIDGDHFTATGMLRVLDDLGTQTGSHSAAISAVRQRS